MGAMILVGSICLVFGNVGMLGCRQDGLHSKWKDRIQSKQIIGGIGKGKKNSLCGIEQTLAGNTEEQFGRLAT